MKSKNFFHSNWIAHDFVWQFDWTILRSPQYENEVVWLVVLVSEKQRFLAVGYRFPKQFASTCPSSCEKKMAWLLSPFRGFGGFGFGPFGGKKHIRGWGGLDDDRVDRSNFNETVCV